MYYKPKSPKFTVELKLASEAFKAMFSMFVCQREKKLDLTITAFHGPELLPTVPWGGGGGGHKSTDCFMGFE
jgi:hypothetical protein